MEFGLNNDTKRNYWQSINDKFISSGLGQREFAKLHNISHTRLSYWHNKFKNKPYLTEPQFVAAEIGYEQSAANIDYFKLTLPNGCILELSYNYLDKVLTQLNMG